LSKLRDEYERTSSHRYLRYIDEKDQQISKPGMKRSRRLANVGNQDVYNMRRNIFFFQLNDDVGCKTPSDATIDLAKS